jgi:transposase-like protein
MRSVARAVYNILALNREGRKDLIGMYVSESEGARFWLQVLTDLKNRGLQDILIACIDNLKGFAEAIASIFPQTQVQSCVIHQIRNSLKYVSSKDQKEFLQDLKPVYAAINIASAEEALLELSAKWEKKYPLVINSWQHNWGKLSTYFQYTEPIRRIIYTTNTIEGFHRQVRKVTKTDPRSSPGLRSRGFSLRYGPAQTHLPDHAKHCKKMDHARSKLELDLITTLNYL